MPLNGSRETSSVGWVWTQLLNRRGLEAGSRTQPTELRGVFHPIANRSRNVPFHPARLQTRSLAMSRFFQYSYSELVDSPNGLTWWHSMPLPDGRRTQRQQPEQAAPAQQVEHPVDPRSRRPCRQERARHRGQRRLFLARGPGCRGGTGHGDQLRRLGHLSDQYPPCRRGLGVSPRDPHGRLPDLPSSKGRSTSSSSSACSTTRKTSSPA